MAKIYALLCFVLSSTLLFAQPAFIANPIEKNATTESLEELINDFEVYEIDAKALDAFVQKYPGESFSLVFDKNNQWHLDLFPHDLLANNYAHQTSSGVSVPKSSKIITYQGLLKNKNGQETAMTIDDNLIYGYVELDHEMIFIEPLRFLLGKEVPQNWYVVYNGENVIDKSGTCAATDLHDHQKKHEASIPEVAGNEKMTCHTLEIAIASDFSMFQKYGSIGAVDGHNLGVLNNVQTNYDDEFVEEIQFEVVTSFTVDCSGCDPWSATDNAGTLLGSFRSWGNGGGFGGGVTYDVAELWTDRNIQANGNFGVIGIAYVPGICNANRYHVLEDYSSTAWRLRVLTSHELGHNFSSGHDGAGSGFIMAPSVNNTNTWSGGSQGSINNYINNLVNNGCLAPCGVFIPPVADFTANVQSGCVPLEVFFTDLSENNPTSWNWSFPGGLPASSTIQNPSVFYPQAGTYPVTLTVTNPAGTDMITYNDYIVVDDQPNADFGFQIASNTVVFEDLSIGATTYLWDFGDGTGSTDANPINVYAQDGIYDVVLLIENSCGVSTSIQQVVIVTLPTADFSVAATQGCAPYEVFFNNESSANSTAWEWAFPGGNPSTSTNQFPIVVYDTPGTYDVTLIAYNAAGTDVTTQIGYIEVLPPTLADFTFSVSNSTVDFTNASSNATTYAWDFGDNNVSNAENPQHVYTADGNYFVTLIATGPCGEAEQIIEVVISNAPVASFAADFNSGCSPLTVNFSSTTQGNIDNYNWTFPGGNPASSTDENPTVIYDAVGSYTVSLQVSNGSGTDVIEMMDYITVGTTVSADFDYSISGTVVSFTPDDTNADSYLWDFGGGNQSMDMNPSFDFLTFGNFTVSLTTSNACGNETAQETFEINILPVAGFTQNQTAGCAPFTVQYTDQSSANTDGWDWSFPGGSPSTSTNQNPLVTYDNAGQYDVSLTVSNEVGQDVSSMQDLIVVTDVPTGSISFTQVDNSFDFASNAMNSDSYSWDFGDGQTSNLENPTHVFAIDQIYTVTLTLSNACGDVTDTEIINLTTSPVAAFSSNATSGCEGDDVQFFSNATGTVTAWAWEFPGGTPATSSDENPIVQYNTAGTYDVTLTVSNSTESDASSSTDYITIGSAPISDFSYVVNGLQVDFTANATNAANYEWTISDGATTNVQNPIHTFSMEGSYTVELEVSNACSTDSHSVTIELTLAPQAGITVANAVGCSPFEVQYFDNSTGSVDSWDWSFPGGSPSSSTMENPIVTYGNAGTYSATLTASNAVGSDAYTAENVVVVGEGPTANFTTSINGLTVDFANNSSDNAGSYSWDFDDGSSSNEENPTHTFSAEGTYLVELEVSNDCGTDNYEIAVQLILAPQADITVSSAIGCSPFEVQYFDNSSGTVENWDWSFPGGSPSASTAVNPVVTYANPGVYDAMLTVSNNMGSDSYTLENVVEVGDAPTASFTAGINGLSVDFLNASSNDSYLWDFGDGQSSNAANPSHTYTAEAIYLASLTVSNDCGTDVFELEIDLTVAPSAGFTVSVLGADCAPSIINFEDNSTGTVDSWLWEFPGGTPATSTSSSPVVTYENAGSYDVTLTVANASTSDTYVLNNAVAVGGSPTVDFNFNFDFLTVNFLNNSIDGNSYAWDFGDGNTSMEENPTHTYAFDGIFDVTLEVSNGCGTTTSSQQVNLTSTPLASINVNGASEGCPGLTVAYEDGSSGTVTSWNWTFPGGTPSSSTLQNPTVTYDTPGQYDVNLEVSSNAGIDQINLTNVVAIESLPVATFVLNNQSPTFDFTNQSQFGNSYLWNFGDGTTSNEVNPSHTYAMDGDYTVSLTTTNACGEDITTQTVAVVTGPTANFMAVNTAGCAPFEVQLADMSSDNVDQWSWSFPGGTPETSDEQNPVVMYNSAGAFDVFLTVSNAAGQVSTSRLGYIEVNEIPVVDFSYSQNANALSFVNSTSNFTVYNWDFGDGITSNELDPTHTYAANGSYTVTLTASNDCGESTSSQTVTIGSITIPVANFTIGQTEGCAPFSTNFTNASSDNADSWNWTFDGGAPSSFVGANPPQVSYAAPGQYNVMLIASNASGADTMTLAQSITVLDEPIAQFTVSQNALAISFNANENNNATYSWYFGDNNTATGHETMHTYGTAGTYEVSLTATNECGTTTSMTTITVSECSIAPVAQFNADMEAGCAPMTVQFMDLSSNAPTSWNWNFEGGTPNISTDQNPSITYNLPGAYEVSLKITNSAGEDNLVVAGYINVLPTPVADFNFAINASTEVSFESAALFATTYAWDFGDGSSSDDANPMHTYTSSGVYEVTLTVTNECGTESITQEVEVIINSLQTLEGITDLSIYPNPNSGVFTVQIAGNSEDELHLEILDVLGQLVKRKSIRLSTDLQEQIDISFMASGTYFLKLSNARASIYRKIILSK